MGHEAGTGNSRQPAAIALQAHPCSPSLPAPFPWQPAFWLFPTELKYGKWAASGEIDVMESVNDLNRITQGLHYGGAGAGGGGVGGRVVVG